MEHCTSQDTIRENLRCAGKFVIRLGNLASLTEASVRAWLQARLGEVSRKTVNLEMDTLRQLLDLCQRFGWRDDNPAWTLGKLPWKPSRLPRALTVTQIDTPLQAAQVLGQGAPPLSRASQCYRMVVAGIFFGLRRGEIQHLLWSDTNGRQVIIQGKTLPDGRSWLPKDREARVIAYPGIDRPIALVFGETPHEGYLFSPAADRRRRFDADALTKIAGRLLTPIPPSSPSTKHIRLHPKPDVPLLTPIHPELTLHCFRHTFATWRLLMGDCLLQVQYWLGHSSAETSWRFAPVQSDPIQDVVPLLG
jgi:integrase